MPKSTHNVILFGPPAAAVIWLVPFSALCLRSRSLLGHWPSGKLDHLTIADSYPLHDSITMGWLLIAFFLFIPWLVAARAFAKRQSVGHGSLLLAAAGWCLFVFAIYFGAGWYVD